MYLSHLYSARWQILFQISLLAREIDTSNFCSVVFSASLLAPPKLTACSGVKEIQIKRNSLNICELGLRSMFTRTVCVPIFIRAWGGERQIYQRWRRSDCFLWHSESIFLNNAADGRKLVLGWMPYVFFIKAVVILIGQKASSGSSWIYHTYHYIRPSFSFLFSSLPGRRLRSDRKGDRRSGCWQIQPLQTVTQYIVPRIQILRRNYYVTHWQ